MVVVDVVVRTAPETRSDNLKHTDFVVSENKKPQAIKTFDEHTMPTLSRQAAASGSTFRGDIFTDCQPRPPDDSTLNVLLLDALNTPMKDQAYVRYQLQQFVKNEKPGTRIAIFGLTDHPDLLAAGFQLRPEVLKAAVEHRTHPTRFRAAR